jgi:hypothetical protein
MALGMTVPVGAQESAISGSGGSGGGVTTAGGSGTANRIVKFQSATTLADSTLTDNGTVVTGTLPLRLANGSVTAPAYSFTSDTNAGLFMYGVDQIAMTPNGGGTELLLVDGNVQFKAETDVYSELAAGYFLAYLSANSRFAFSKDASEFLDLRYADSTSTSNTKTMIKIDRRLTGASNVGDGVSVTFWTDNDASAQTQLAEIATAYTDPTAGSEAAELSFALRGTGGLLKRLVVNPSGTVTSTATDTATATTTTVLALQHNSTGTPTAGFGTGLALRAKTATVADRELMNLFAEWRNTSATDSTRSSEIVMTGVDNGTTYRFLEMAGPTAALRTNSVWIGYNAGNRYSTGDVDITAVGSSARAAARGVAIGANATTGNATSVVSIGAFAQADGAYTTVVGASASSGAVRAICLGAYSVGAPYSIVIGGGGAVGLRYNDTYLGTIADPAPTAMTLHSSGASGTNVAGADFRIAGGVGTGTGMGGSVQLQTAPAGSSGTTQNSLVDRIIVNAKPKTLTDATLTSLFDVSLPSGAMAGCAVEYLIECTDGTDMQSAKGRVTFSVANKSGTYTAKLGASDVAIDTEGGADVERVVATTGTMTNTWKLVSGTDKVTLQVKSDTSLTPTTFRVTYTIINDAPRATTIS